MLDSAGIFSALNTAAGGPERTLPSPAVRLCMLNLVHSSSDEIIPKHIIQHIMQDMEHFCSLHLQWIRKIFGCAENSA
jgi:hypothetical protein